MSNGLLLTLCPSETVGAASVLEGSAGVCDVSVCTGAGALRKRANAGMAKLKSSMAARARVIPFPTPIFSTGLPNRSETAAPAADIAAFAAFPSPSWPFSAGSSGSN